MSRGARARNGRHGQPCSNLAPDVSFHAEQVVTVDPNPAETDTVDSPLTPQAGTTSEADRSSPLVPAKDPYDEFGDHFDQEDEVDDYALLHPNSPKQVQSPAHSTVDPVMAANSPLPFHGAPEGSTQQIRFVSPIVLTHSPIGMPADIPVPKRQRKKASSPDKQSPERIPASAKGKTRDFTLDEDDPDVPVPIINYWATNPALPSANPAPLFNPLRSMQASDMVVPQPDTDNSQHIPGVVDIAGLVRDINMYAQQVNELSPRATAGLIYHAHRKLQDSLLNAPQLTSHAIPSTTALPQPAPLPSPNIVRPGTSASNFPSPPLCLDLLGA
jgi:hypothetical protein